MRLTIGPNHRWQSLGDRHQSRRGPEWQTKEAPLELPTVLALSQGPVLVDCLSLWLTNYLLAERDWQPAKAQLIEAVASYADPLVLVSNEVGLGGITSNKLQRDFADAAGLLNQELAQACQQVVFVAAGLPLPLKS